MDNKTAEIDRNPQLDKITVIVPVCNAAATLRQCLQALRSLADHNYEVIVVDDHSTDNSLEICKEFNFRVLSLAINKGQAVARNSGVKEATGEIVAFVDSDVIVPPDWLKKYRYLLTVFKDADMICSEYSGSITTTEPALFAFYETSYRRLNLPLYINSSTSSNCVIYKHIFEEVGVIRNIILMLKRVQSIKRPLLLMKMQN